MPNDHLDNHGCWKCAREVIANCNRYTTEEFFNEIKMVHGDKYIYVLNSFTGVNDFIKIDRYNNTCILFLND